MSDCMNTVSDFTNVREAVCVTVQKIMDACRDQDCAENVPVYLTADSQRTLENADSAKARSAELLYADVEVEPLQYQDGYYCVNTRLYYRVIADAVTCGVRPVTVYGLAVTDQQAMLYGGEGSASTFTSNGTAAAQQPTGVVEAVDPMILCARVVNLEEDPEEGAAICIGELPEAVTAAFDDELAFEGMTRQLQVTLGQFSLMRLERQTQLLIPSYDYCMPSRACSLGDCGCAENPCEAFARMQFPVSAFFPVDSDTVICGGQGDCGCGCGGDENAGEGEDRPCSPAGSRSGSGRRR